MIVILDICYIIGSCVNNNDDLKFRNSQNDMIIAADGGYDALKKICIEPDMLIGDFDSISSIPSLKTTLKYPVEKDETDMFLAYQLGYKKGYRHFVIIGGIGGRMDHTIANLQMLCHIAQNGASAYLVGEGNVITSIHNQAMTFPSSLTGKIGVFANGNDARGVTLKNLRYTLKDAVLTANFPLGVSNEFISSDAYVSVKDGTLLISWCEKAEEFLYKFFEYKKTERFL